MEKTKVTKRHGIKRGIYILPNLMTTGNLFCGFFAIARTINGDFWTAAWAILLAGIFDFLDGRVARITRTESGFGLEYDSLVDLASFGLAPAILMYKWTLLDFHRIGWTAAFVFFACGALRLARFNVQVANVEKKTFQGLPIPAAAYCLASFVILYHHLFGDETPEGSLLVVGMFIVAFLMVSNIPYRSFKQIDFKKRASFFILVFLVVVLFVIASEPQVMLFVVSLIYVTSGVLEMLIRSPKRLKDLVGIMSQSIEEKGQGRLKRGGRRRGDTSLKVIGTIDDKGSEGGEKVS